MTAVSGGLRRALLIVETSRTQARRPSEAGRPVVVGVDGSAHSFRAIDRAVEEAARLGVGLELVHAFDDRGFVVITLIPGDGSEQLRLSAEAVLREALAAAEGRGVLVEGFVAAGPPGAVLVEASEHASLLVVGRRGRSTARRPSVASVPSACLRSARCPVVVVPCGDRSEALVGAASR